MGLNSRALVKENRFGITAKYGGELPELPEYQGLQNGDDTISRLMRGFMNKNDRALDKLGSDRPEERYRLKPHVYVDPQDDRPSTGGSFQGNDTFNDRSSVGNGTRLYSDTKFQNFDVVDKWEKTIQELKKGQGIRDGIRETQYPLKPKPFNALH
jgi:hypothetical protein